MITNKTTIGQATLIYSYKKVAPCPLCVAFGIVLLQSVCGVTSYIDRHPSVIRRHSQSFLMETRCAHRPPKYLSTK
ncbi:MAG: hypothetical protein Harvfovirus2_83 [Harvfovirus sp.]|uniref:Uncharacterized protein n=1 Tax=Harvfovirus sp. TaxID=2487768 RepID=A0A3G5A404_9VIRU|nr:MAG: hypothetical protein Harvfovirus2_83 [Harvfovirus sp.]